LGFLSKELYLYNLVLAGSRNEFERDITLKLTKIEGIIED